MVTYIVINNSCFAIYIAGPIIKFNIGNIREACESFVRIYYILRILYNSDVSTMQRIIIIL